MRYFEATQVSAAELAFADEESDNQVQHLVLDYGRHYHSKGFVHLGQLHVAMPFLQSISKMDM